MNGSTSSPQENIRNFAIIAHIDHGKSTLADRLLEMTGTVAHRDMSNQLLDSNPIERERGITIKLAPVRMEYQFSDFSSQLSGKSQSVVSLSVAEKQKTDKLQTDNRKQKTDNYILNLIDTPGHVDFSYEVSRSLAACEGAILVVDATQGVQAQTLAHLHQARLHNLSIIPVINKIDMPNARIEETYSELRSLEFRDEEIIEISAKVGTNVDRVLDAIVERVPAPRGNNDSPLRALVFSSQYDPHKGVVVFVRVVDGEIIYKPNDGLGSQKKFQSSSIAGNKVHISNPKEQGEAAEIFSTSRALTKLLFMASGAEVTPIEVGFFMPKMVRGIGLGTGEVGYIATGLKDIRFAKVGDTITYGENSKSQISMTKQISNLKSQNLNLINHTSAEENSKFQLQISKQVQNSNNNLTIKQYNNVVPLEGYKEPKPMVFLSLFPVSADEFTASREAMEKLRLSDSAFTFRPISSAALGNGFHCGFLGLLHAEVVQERILREFNLTMIATAPSVEYRLRLKPNVDHRKYGFTDNQLIKMTDDSSKMIDDRSQITDERLIISEKEQNTDSKAIPSSLVTIQSASEYPDPTIIDEVKEPMMSLTIFTPKRYVGAVMQLAQEKRAEYIDLKYLGDQAEFTYLIPLAEMIIDFFDRLKSVTEGYASLDYEFFDWQTTEVAKVDILLNHEKVDALSFLVVRDQAQRRAREIVERLSEVIPRQQFNIPVQGAIGGAIIARSDIKPFRKDVIQKLYGGDRTRKDKLLKKQKKGKAKMKLIGRVEIPQTAFFEVLKRE